MQEIVRYCFLKDEFIGVLHFKSDGSKVFRWISDDDLSDFAKRWKAYYPLSSVESINQFISGRCIEQGRPDRALWLSLIGLSSGASMEEIFLRGHGVSINDCFWCDERDDSGLWKELNFTRAG